MKNITVRTLSGAVYITIIIGSILLSKYVFFGIILFSLSYTLYEFFRLSNKGGINPQLVFGIIVSLFVYISTFLVNQNILDEKIYLSIIPLILLIPIIEIFRKSDKKILNIAYTIFGVIYFAFPFSFLNLILTPISNHPEIYKPELLIGLFIMIWVNDTGAYIVGRLMGKHKMVEKISPNKTWEGTVGGAIFSVMSSLLYFSFFKIFDNPIIIILSLVTVTAGTFGDLTESLVKRNFNVKDSGNIMPGHGGLFDRFDSILFAAPVYYIFVAIFLN